jgi:putative ABC transport system permease protein
MAVAEYARIATRNLARRRRRTALTMLGIVIGIAIVIAFVSLGDGLKTAVTAQLGSLGKDLVYVFPGAIGSPGAFAGGIKFDQKDVDVVEGTRGVKLADLILHGNLVLDRKGERKEFLVHGMGLESQTIFGESQGYELAQGRWFRKGETAIVLGAKTARKGFKEPVRLNQKLGVNGRNIDVVGILKETGGDTEPDTSAYLDRDLLAELTGGRLGAGAIFAQLSPGADPDETAELIQTRLERSRGAEDFEAFTNQRALAAVSGVLGVIQLFLVGVAGIALVVGGIGIMNTMYTSVLERTKEIGILKAVGARDRDVLTIFLLESGLLGLAGGAAGVTLGFLLAKLVEGAARSGGFPQLQVSLTPELAALGLGFSFLVGVASGVLPARQASRLRPVEALRYE